MDIHRCASPTGSASLPYSSTAIPTRQVDNGNFRYGIIFHFGTTPTSLRNHFLAAATISPTCCIFDARCVTEYRLRCSVSSYVLSLIFRRTLSVIYGVSLGGAGALEDALAVGAPTNPAGGMFSGMFSRLPVLAGRETRGTRCGTARAGVRLREEVLNFDSRCTPAGQGTTAAKSSKTCFVGQGTNMQRLDYRESNFSTLLYFSSVR